MQTSTHLVYSQPGCTVRTTPWKPLRVRSKLRPWQRTFVFLDFETGCKVDIDLGAHRYVKDPSCHVLCLAYRIVVDGKLIEAGLWTPVDKEGNVWEPRRVAGEIICVRGPQENTIKRATKGALNCPFGLRDALSAGFPVYAHNVKFDSTVWDVIMVERYDWPAVEVEQLNCSSALCLSNGLMPSLEKSADILYGTELAKDLAGYQAMMKCAKPVLSTGAWNRLDGSDFQKTLSYCEQDVAVGTNMVVTLKSLSKMDRRLSWLDIKMNNKGIAIDHELAECVTEMATGLELLVSKRLINLSRRKIWSAGQTKAIVQFCHSFGFTRVKSLDKNNIPELLSGAEDSPIPGDSPEAILCRAIIKIRKDMSSSALKKFQRMLESVVWEDGVPVIHDYMIFYGAARTGRYSSVGIQLQNLVRSKIKEDAKLLKSATEMILLAISLLKKKNLKAIEKTFPYISPFAVASSTVRSALIARPGRVFYCADYSGVEYRLICWLSNALHRVESTRKYDATGDKALDPYIALASEIYSKRVLNVTPEERQLGKIGVLSCGYGISGKGLVGSAWKTYQVRLELDMAKRIVSAYADMIPEVPIFWADCQDAFMAATAYGETTEIRGMKFFQDEMEDVRIRLLSGRELVYHKPFLAPGEYGVDIHYWGKDQKTHQWAKTRTFGGAIVGHITQATARDLMAERSLAAYEAGYEPLLTVHDENLTERDLGCGSLKEFVSIMEELPPWLEGFPCKTSSWEGTFYRK